MASDRKGEVMAFTERLDPRDPSRVMLELEDGTILGFKSTVSHVMFTNTYSPDGVPIYKVFSSNTVQILRTKKVMEVSGP